MNERAIAQAPSAASPENASVAVAPSEHGIAPGTGVLAEDRIAVATQWQLMWWRFRKHKFAVGGALVLVAFYVVALFADFFAYVDPTESDAQRSLMVPQPIH